MVEQMTEYEANIDNILRDIQTSLIKLTNAIQAHREDLANISKNKKFLSRRTRKEKSILDTANKINEVFKELGYSKD